MKKVVLCLAILVGFTLGAARAAEPTGAEPTCGQMISSMAAIPAKLSEGAATVADMWEAHAALMGKDKDSVAEAKGLRALAKGHRQIAASLMKASEEMKKAASWAGAPHDMAKMMSDPKLAEASKKMVEIHKEIIAMFQKSLAEMEAQHKAMK
jgi:uncharacterized coiled-coil DUF342 family protein